MTADPGPALGAGDRPLAHLTPSSGWMNDPNGLIFKDGVLHAFFQLEPDQPRWGRMRWGHATSHDLLTWQHEPIALEPSVDGHDSLGCWSGCLLLDDEGSPTIFYTGVARDRGLRRATIGLARGSADLRTWTKDPDGPVIRRPPSGVRPDRFRDPFVWRDADGWAMLVGAGTTRALGRVLLYRSDDLMTWRYVGPFLTTEDVIAADQEVRIEDIDSPCWECPQLIRAPDADILIVSAVDRSPRFRPAHVIAFVGRVTGDRFRVHRTERLGLGPDFYAPALVTAPDGRHLLLGWVPEDPPARGSTRTWSGALTFPRVVSLDGEGRVIIALADGVRWPDADVTRLPDTDVRGDTPWVAEVDHGHVELTLRIHPGDAASIRFDISSDDGSAAEIRFEPRDRRLTITRAGSVMVAGRDPHGSTILPPVPGDAVRLRLILDGSVLEMVVDDRVTATARLPHIGPGRRTIECSTIGGACRLTELTVTPIVRQPGSSNATPRIAQT